MTSIFFAENIAAMYREVATKYPDRPAFATRDKSKVYHPVTFRDFYERSTNLATALIDLGLQPKEKVALMADNRFEWILADCAVQLCGAADVPRGTDVTDADINYIIPHSESSFVFVEHKAMLDKLLRNKKSLANIKQIILMDPNAPAQDGVLSMSELLEKGKELREKGDRRVEERIEAIQPDDLFTLIYTSGTTGVPKGVMLSHGNMISQVRDCPVIVFENDRILSILPIWHVFERMFTMLAVSRGVCTYYTSIRNIREDLKIVRPTIMASSPRLWEMVYQGIVKNVESAPALNRKLFKAAYFFASRFKLAVRFLTFNHLDTHKRSPLLSLGLGILHFFSLILFALPFVVLDRIVLSKIRAATGGVLRGSISGGGALPLHIDLFFNNIGLPVLEGYGLTETSPVLAVRTFKKIVIGSVGPLWPNTELRLVDVATQKVVYPPKRGMKGEIQVKGPQVMQGYYKNPEMTAKVLKDGWFHTGDLGMITFNDCLKIVGRTKETVVLLGGENVEPVPLENKLLESPLIEQVMVVGQDRKYLCALVVPALEQFKDYGSSLEELSGNEEVYGIIREDIKRLISNETGFKSFERVVDCRILPKKFEVGEEMTNTFKIKRDLIAEKYAKEIESMY